MDLSGLWGGTDYSSTGWNISQPRETPEDTGSKVEKERRGEQ